MYHYLGRLVDAEWLVHEICEIELYVLKKPIGIQDQYIAAYGGQKFISLLGRMSGVTIESIGLNFAR
jgi:D-glycero-alpha-D-manno-heptose-7-phosphate kinase